MSERFKIRFPSAEAMQAAQAVETLNSEVVLKNEKRAYVALEVPQLPEVTAKTEQSDAIRGAIEFAPELQQFAEQYGAEIVRDYQFDLEMPGDGFSFEAVDETPSGSLPDVTEMINAPAAWKHTTGGSVTIAVVDTGIDGTHPEFPDWKKAGSWEAPGESAWTDWQGHGTMCAAICGASDANSGSRYRGVAPDAKLIACRTRFFDSELGAIYDYLIGLVGTLDGPLVATNSFGHKTGSPPPLPGQLDFIDAMEDAIQAGIFVFFSAGNNHELAQGAPSACSPNSVWLHKSRSDVFPVATCDLERAMWFYSSRGPGQHFGDAGTSEKPDVTAPTPKNGKILYGGDERVLANGWGTSGACPQAAGLAALLLDLDGGLARDELFDAIRNSAVDLGFGHTCQGAGMLDCGASVDHIRKKLVS
ncbi:MAG: S8 family peptidase [Paracoccus sp. (in: a-proteobacteria)]|uniref:S8 family peptidase n=1 Tax=Paracoccus sp. TaxID=267 RepID=UPI00405A0182